MPAPGVQIAIPSGLILAWNRMGSMMFMSDDPNMYAGPSVEACPGEIRQAMPLDLSHGIEGQVLHRDETYRHEGRRKARLAVGAQRSFIPPPNPRDHPPNLLDAQLVA